MAGQRRAFAAIANDLLTPIAAAHTARFQAAVTACSDVGDERCLQACAAQLEESRLALKAARQLVAHGILVSAAALACVRGSACPC